MRRWIALSLLVLTGCGDDKTGEIVVTRCLKREPAGFDFLTEMPLSKCVAWERRCYKDGREVRCAS